MTNPCYVYLLRAKGSEYIRYVGVTMRPSTRWQNHKCGDGNNRKTEWLNLCKKHGVETEMIILCRCEDVEATRVERNLIQAFRVAGYNLLNISNGGYCFDPKNKEGKPRRLTVSFDADILAALRNASDSECVSVNYIVNRILKECLLP